jgi:hypothetical protein
MVSTLSGSSDYNNVGGGVPMPSFMLVRMRDDEPSVVIIGDSIENNADQGNLYTSRHASASPEMGLDDDVFTRRVATGCFAVPGWGYVDTLANSHGNATAAQRQLKIVEMARALNQGQRVCDHLYSGHGTNSSTQPVVDQRRSMRTLHSLWKTALGCSASTQGEMLPNPTSTDGFNTLVNQVTTGAAAFPAGGRWIINEDIGGPDGLGDPAATFRADGTIDDSIGLWRISAADLGANRDKLAVRPFNTTLAADFNGTGGVISLTDNPPLGSYVSINNGASYFLVGSVTGTGPFLASGVFAFGGTVAASAGAIVRDTAHGTGLHPGALLHREYAIAENDSIRAWKVRQGWVKPLALPAITNAEIDGSPEDGQTLSVSFDVTGFPVPTVAYQWRRNGASISGQTSAAITLDETGMGLADGDAVSCLVTATNSEGVATAEPSVVYSAAAEVAAFLALINASADSGFFDFTNATAPAGVFTALDENGGASFAAPASFQSPGISATLGALFNSTSNRLISRTVTNAAYDMVFAFKKDAGNTAARLVNNTTVGVYTSGSATAVPVTTTVDGASVATQGAFFTAIDTATEHIIVLQNYSPGSTVISLGSASFAPLGSMRRAAIIRRSDFPTTLDDVRAAAVAAVVTG